MNPAALELYHDGDLVRLNFPKDIYLHDNNAVVMYIIRAGEPYVCPFCHRKCKAKPCYGRTDAVGYFLDTQHPQSCCKPWGYDMLKREHDVSPLSYHEILGEISRE